MMSRRFWKRSGVALCIFFVLMLGLYVFRDDLLYAAGRGLISTDPLEHADAIFIPGGSVYNRGISAAYLFQRGYADTIVTLGANSPSSLAAYGIHMTDAALNARMLARFCNIPRSHIVPAAIGTSSIEEMESLMKISAQYGWDTVMVVSDYFHTRRLRFTIDLISGEDAPTVLITGCPNMFYKPDLWWQSEAGLIALNNEYIKLMYYCWRY